MLAVLAVWSVCLWVVGAEAMGGGWAASVELGAAQLAALAVVLAIPSHLAHTVVMLWGRLRWPAAMAVQVAMAERSETVVRESRHPRGPLRLLALVTAVCAAGGLLSSAGVHFTPVVMSAVGRRHPEQ